MNKYLRVCGTDIIYPYNAILAANPNCEAVSEEEAFPEQFMPPAAKKYRTHKTAALQEALSTPVDALEAPHITDPALAAEAARGWPK